jgi:imidazolonepropionase-like amidohydrolase
MGRWLIAAVFLTGVAAAQSAPPNDVTPFISVQAPVVVLNHVRVIDGTGAPAAENQIVVITDGKIQAVGNFGAVTIPANAQQQDRTGYTVIPGLVGMHNHLYYTNSYSVQVAKGEIDEPGLSIIELPYSAPRLYLAAGVTTMRTTGSLEPYTDIKVK